MMIYSTEPPAIVQSAGNKLCYIFCCSITQFNCLSIICTEYVHDVPLTVCEKCTACGIRWQSASSFGVGRFALRSATWGTLVNVCGRLCYRLLGRNATFGVGSCNSPLNSAQLIGWMLEKGYSCSMVRVMWCSWTRIIVGLVSIAAIVKKKYLICGEHTAFPCDNDTICCCVQLDDFTCRLIPFPLLVRVSTLKLSARYTCHNDNRLCCPVQWRCWVSCHMTRSSLGHRECPKDHVFELWYGPSHIYRSAVVFHFLGCA